MTESSLTVSLEPHLVETLSPLVPLLPPHLSSSLDNILSSQINNTSNIDSKTSEISYSLLSQISQWSRTPSSRTLLQSAKLDPNAYLMISLLAGTRTSPYSKFPKYDGRKSLEEEDAARFTSDKKEITAIINSLLTVIASGAAAWWAADKVGWRDEYKVLLALFTSIVVAISEAALYLIWQSRKSKSSSQTTRTRSIVSNKKQDDESLALRQVAGASVLSVQVNEAISSESRATREISENDSEHLRRRRPKPRQLQLNEGLDSPAPP